MIEIAAIRKAVLLVPSQMLAVMRWVLDQEWADPKRYSLLGYSFGAMFVPAVQRYAQANALEIPTTVIAYGGTDVYRLLMSNIKITPMWVRSALGYLAAKAIWAIEPALHLPYLEGQFLIINGKYDTQIPESSWRNLQKITPPEKTIINLETDHMRPSRPETDCQTRWYQSPMVIGKAGDQSLVFSDLLALLRKLLHDETDFLDIATS